MLPKQNVGVAHETGAGGGENVKGALEGSIVREWIGLGFVIDDEAPNNCPGVEGLNSGNVPD